MLFKSIATLALAGAAIAQRPSNTSICDYYTTALLKNNTGANQYTLLTLLVNTAVIGNYSQINTGTAVPGILNPNGTYNGTAVNLVPYFSGALLSTNDGGSTGVSKNFLDGGGATPLMNNTPANSNSSNQYALMTHLYEFFGLLLGCSQVGNSGFPAYSGRKSMYEVHKFMVLDPKEMGYFIEQVALSAKSFGVADSDIQTAGMALNSLFNYRCSPPVTSVAALNGTLQSTCTDPSCPLDPNSNCTGQETIASPQMANSTNSSSGSSSSMSMSGSATSTAAGGAGGASMTTTGSGAAATTSRPASSANQVAAAGALGFLGAAVALLL